MKSLPPSRECPLLEKAPVPERAMPWTSLPCSKPPVQRADMLDRNTQDREAGIIQSANGDEIDSKLLGAHAAYARGLTPRHAGGMLAWQRL